MAQKLLKTKTHKIAPKKIPVEEARKVVLVGTYRGDQLEAWPGYYNYPLAKKDKVDVACAKKVNEIWLFQGARDGRFFAAEFVGEFTRDRLVSEFGYPAKGRGHGDTYLLYKISKTEIYNPAKGLVDAVIVRTKDFATAPKVRKLVKAYLESPERNDPIAANLVPKILTKVPHEVLRVCDAAVQMDFIEPLENIRIMRNASNWAFTAIELFAGAGGLSIGLEKAGIHVVIANEIMPDFAATLARNHPETKVINEDVHKIDFSEELSKLGLKSVDVLSGGPPCQGFSTIGSKNRKDPRNSLFYEYLRAVAETKPKYTIFENVSGFKRLYNGSAYKTLIEEMNELGYMTACQILNAADYGAPQIRYRTIVLGWRKELPPLTFPKPTYGTKSGNPYVTLMDAIGDLPPLEAGESVTKYANPPTTAYQRRMRGNQDVLLEHNAANYGAKMQEILHLIPAGGCIKDLPERLRPMSAYSNTYARLLPNIPSPTITRNFGTPSSSRCVHPYQARALSTREGARLQGFPDDYIFIGGKQSKNLQIGNAVPPILGEAIAKMVRDALEKHK